MIPFPLDTCPAGFLDRFVLEANLEKTTIISTLTNHVQGRSYRSFCHSDGWHTLRKKFKPPMSGKQELGPLPASHFRTATRLVFKPSLIVIGGFGELRLKEILDQLA